jgi:hypothetical protein
MKLQPQEVQAAYLEKVNEFLGELRSRCAQYRIDLLEVDIARGFNQVLSEYLIKRNSMR